MLMNLNLRPELEKSFPLFETSTSNDPSVEIGVIAVF